MHGIPHLCGWGQVLFFDIPSPHPPPRPKSSPPKPPGGMHELQHSHDFFDRPVSSPTPRNAQIAAVLTTSM